MPSRAMVLSVFQPVLGSDFSSKLPQRQAGCHEKVEGDCDAGKKRVTMSGKEIAKDDRQDMVQISDIDLTWQRWSWRFFQAK
jgi:hypothetical protein